MFELFVKVLLATWYWCRILPFSSLQLGHVCLFRLRYNFATGIKCCYRIYIVMLTGGRTDYIFSAKTYCDEEIRYNCNWRVFMSVQTLMLLPTLLNRLQRRQRLNTYWLNTYVQIGLCMLTKFYHYILDGLLNCFVNSIKKKKIIIRPLVSWIFLFWFVHLISCKPCDQPRCRKLLLLHHS